MNHAYAVKLTQHLARECFDMELNIPVEITGRLTRCLGRFTYDIYKKQGIIVPKSLQLAERLIKNYNDDTIASVIKHELAHWALCVQGKPFSDGHPVFERELRRVGAHPTGVIKLSGEIHEMKCRGCAKVVVRSNTKGKLNKYIEDRRDYTSKCCKAKLYYAGVRYEEDNNVVYTPTIEIREMKEIKKEVKQETNFKLPEDIGLRIELVLEKGPRGVTNKQMIPAIQKSIDFGGDIAKELLYKLKQAYPEVFGATIRYIGKTYQSQLEMIMS